MAIDILSILGVSSEDVTTASIIGVGIVLLFVFWFILRPILKNWTILGYIGTMVIIAMMMTGQLPNPFAENLGKVQGFAYAIYPDGQLQLIGTSVDGTIKAKTLALFDESGNPIVGIAIAPFVDLYGTTAGEYEIDRVMYQITIIDKTGLTNKVVYESPWVETTQFSVSPNFSMLPPDANLMITGQVKQDAGSGKYMFVKNVSSTATVIALEDPKSPTVAQYATYQGVQCNPIQFRMDTIQAEQSWGEQWSLWSDGQMHTYDVKLAVLLQNTSMLGTDSQVLNVGNSEFTTTFNIQRVSSNTQTIQFGIQWGDMSIDKEAISPP
jgi:hypothetical protein